MSISQWTIWFVRTRVRQTSEETPIEFLIRILCLVCCCLWACIREYLSIRERSETQIDKIVCKWRRLSVHSNATFCSRGHSARRRFSQLFFFINLCCQRTRERYCAHQQGSRGVRKSRQRVVFTHHRWTSPRCRIFSH